MVVSRGFKKKRRTRIARLADFTPPPIEIVARETDPVSRLLLSRTLISGVDDGWVL